MSATYPLTWDATGSRLYETGVDHGVLYPINDQGYYVNGVAWNGLSSISENPEGGEAQDVYADNIKYLSLMSAEKFGATVEAYTYPDEFEKCDGSIALEDGAVIQQQARTVFGLCYRTRIGNDVDGDSKGYKLHLIYGCKAQPSDRSYQTVNDSPEAISFSWELDTTPVSFTYDSKTYTTSVMTIDSTKAGTNLSKLEEVLYGKDAVAPRLPLPSDVASILKNGTVPSTWAK